MQGEAGGFAPIPGFCHESDGLAAGTGGSARSRSGTALAMLAYKQRIQASSSANPHGIGAWGSNSAHLEHHIRCLAFQRAADRPPRRRRHPVGSHRAGAAPGRAGTGGPVRRQPHAGARGDGAAVGARHGGGEQPARLVRGAALARGRDRGVLGAYRDRDGHAELARQAAAAHEAHAPEGALQGRAGGDQGRRRRQPQLPAGRLPCLPGRLRQRPAAGRHPTRPHRAHHAGGHAVPVDARRRVVVQRARRDRHGAGTGRRERRRRADACPHRRGGGGARRARAAGRPARLAAPRAAGAAPSPPPVHRPQRVRRHGDTRRIE
jgi:hypothetical protein